MDAFIHWASITLLAIGSAEQHFKPRFGCDPMPENTSGTGELSLLRVPRLRWRIG